MISLMIILYRTCIEIFRRVYKINNDDDVKFKMKKYVNMHENRFFFFF